MSSAIGQRHQRHEATGRGCLSTCTACTGRDQAARSVRSRSRAAASSIGSAHQQRWFRARYVDVSGQVRAADGRPRERRVMGRSIGVRLVAGVDAESPADGVVLDSGLGLGSSRRCGSWKPGAQSPDGPVPHRPEPVTDLSGHHRTAADGGRRRERRGGSSGGSRCADHVQKAPLAVDVVRGRNWSFAARNARDVACSLRTRSSLPSHPAGIDYLRRQYSGCVIDRRQSRSGYVGRAIGIDVGGRRKPTPDETASQRGIPRGPSGCVSRRMPPPRSQDGLDQVSIGFAVGSDGEKSPLLDLRFDDPAAALTQAGLLLMSAAGSSVDSSGANDENQVDSHGSPAMTLTSSASDTASPAV